jgi:DNA-binding FadR family transcriptional regulator
MSTAFDQGSFFGPSRTRSSHQHVVRELGMAMVRGDFAVGSVLPGDADLMKRFGVSRTVLREGMKTLAAKGLVRPKAKIGTRVQERGAWNMFDPEMLAWHLELGIDEAFFSSLVDMRLALEPAAASLAARHRNDDDLAVMYRHVDLMERADHTRESFADADLKLHLAIAVASRNPFMRSIGALTEAALAVALKRSSPVDDPRQVTHSAAQHRAIVDAIAERDEDGARRFMIAVINEGAERVRNAAP